MISFSNNRFIKFIFFGNYFYGLCAVALSIEATLQQRYPLNNFLYYCLAFSSTVLFYTKAYTITEVPGANANLRTLWYGMNKKLVWGSQLAFLLFVLAYGAWFMVTRWENILSVNSFEWLLMTVFPFVSGFYYGVQFKEKKYNLRNIGWLKPFIIGFTWAGLVTVYPILYYCINNGVHYQLGVVSCFLFIKNFMFVTVLCIMFDIKDFAMDYNQKVKTFVVKTGIRKTIFYIIIPLSLIGLASFICYALALHFNAFKILLNTIPFLLIIAVAYGLHSRRSIFYYLVIIDGLMLVKAFCGISAMIFF